MALNRRALLRGALALAAAPPLIRTAFASSSPELQRGALSAALRGAVAASRPLLVIVIPEESDKWARGTFWGELLNHGGDAQLARFGRCDVVCASLADLRRLVPEVPGEPWMVLVTSHQAQLRALGWSVQLPEIPPMQDSGDEHWYTARDARDTLWVQQRLQAFERDVGGPLDAALGPLPDARIGPLATAARAALVAQPPPGAHWANSWGCGADVEGVEATHSVDCGMGHVGPMSSRLLYFFDLADDAL